MRHGDDGDCGGRFLLHEPAQTVPTVDPGLVRQLTQRPAYGDLTHLIHLTEYPLAWKFVARRPVANPDTLDDPASDLPVQRL